MEIWRKPHSLTHHKAELTGLNTTVFCCGIPFTVLVIQIPLRFQAVDQISAFQAGVRLLPFTLGGSLGGIIASVSSSHLHVHAIIIVAAVIQVLGTSLLASLPIDVGGNLDGFELLTGADIGLMLGVLAILTPQNVKGKGQCKFAILS